MIKFNESKNVYLYSENIDMRMGINKIQILIACNFNQLEIRHSVFVFCSNNGKTIKMYYEDDYGSWLLQNRLHEGKFKWPKGLEIGTKISKVQLEGLCKGLEVIESKKVEEERQKSVPVIKEKIHDLVFNSNPAKNSAFEGAIEYTLDCWDDLFTFVDNGFVEITNNTAERAVKPFVIQRKVFQTSGSYAGARYTGKIFSIFQTCLINNVNVEKYLEYVLNNIYLKPIEELLPYSKNIKEL